MKDNQEDNTRNENSQLGKMKSLENQIIQDQSEQLRQKELEKYLKQW